MKDLNKLPNDLPVPVDDHACDHLVGTELPSISLNTTANRLLNLKNLKEPSIIFFYPRTGEPDKPAPADWDLIPGARGCTPQSCGFRDLYSEFQKMGFNVFGFSSQDTDYQEEFVTRNHIPFEIISDSKFQLTDKLELPTFQYNGQRLIKRMAWIVHDSKILKVFYPVFPPNENAATVLNWLKNRNDEKTISAYSNLAESYSQDWLAQPPPNDMYELLQKFFIPEGKTIDIGCGNGRDANWLSESGFKVSGCDSSVKLVEIASKLYPEIKFQLVNFPKLNEIQEQYQNILCETVIMHLPKDQIPPAIQNLKRVLQKEGILYLSWRVTEGKDARHADGRLYSAFEPKFILDQLNMSQVLHFEDQISASSGKRVCHLIYRG